MSIKLRDLIKQVRACKTAAEERAIITKESALIRTAFKSEDYPEYRHRNVAKLLYIHMLGYPTHFGQMETVKMIASPRFPDKRIGYLALSMLLDERQEVLTLVTNSLQQDLHSSNPFVVGLALTALGNIGGAEMARDLAADVDKHLQHTNPYIRKKAALTTIRLLRKVPDLVDQFLPRIVVLLTDKNHNVLLGGVCLVSAVLELTPALAPKFTRLVPALVKILRKLITAGYAPEYDVGGVTDPFLQARILSLLRQMGRGNESASEAMGSVLAQVTSANTDGSAAARNAGNAVLYEAVATIMAVESESGLRVLGVNILGKFLGSRDPNMKYVALETLKGVVALDPTSVQRHRSVIVECLKDADASIRKRALELAVALVNGDNVKQLMSEMLTYLSAADAESRPDVCARLAAVADVHAPSRAWHIHTLLALLAIAGNAAKREVLSQTLFLISHADGHGALAHALYCHLLGALAATEAGGASCEAQQPLLQAAVWVVGEYGAALTAAPPASAADGAVVSTPSGVALPLPAPRSEAEVVRTLARVLRLYYASAETRAMVLTSLLKLTAWLGGGAGGDPAALAAARALLAEHATSSDVELQSRAVEYGVICAPGGLPGALGDPARVKSELLAAMPLLEEGVLRARAGAATGAATDARALAGDDVAMAVAERSHPKAAATVAAAAPAGSSSSGGGNLLDLDSLFGSVSASAGEGLMMTSSAPAPAAVAAAAPAAAAAAAGDISDLFGLSMAPAAPPAPARMMMAAAAAPAAAPSPAAAPRPAATGVAALDDLFGSASLSMGAAPAPAPSPVATRPLAQPAAPPALGAGGLDDLFGAAPARPAPALAAAAAPSGLGDLFAPAPAPAAAAPPPPPPPAAAASAFGDFEAAPAPAPPSFSLPHTLLAYENASVGLRIVMRCDKPSHASPLTDITASFTLSAGHQPLHGFACQAAVPKFAKITLMPASGTTLVPGGAAVTQVIKVENSAQGTKPLALKLKLLYTPEGAEQLTEVTDVRNFPATL